MVVRRKRSADGLLPFGNGWGGARKGAGRKPNGERAGVSRLRREVLAARFPVHVTVRLRQGLPCLRRKNEYAALRRAFAAGCERFGFRLVQYSVQRDHLHLLAEANGRGALARGMQGLLVRVAKGLNRLWGRRGSVFGDRYHARVLCTPKEVRAALVYVLQNAKKHGLRYAQAVDRFSSAVWFDGWREALTVRGLEGVARPVAASRTWLMGVGWRRHRLLGFDEVPKPAA